MANEEFIFRLGADISQFSQSITQVEAELRRVRSTLRNQTGQAIVETNRYIQQLEGSLVNLRNAGLQPLNRSSLAGAGALNSLGQVARDAPFGFVAIQNNLPIVVDQLTQLSRTSGGATGALKAIGSALIGPAGLSFAFGAVIAGTTALIQKYGSLGNAIDVIFQKNGKLTGEILKAKESYSEFNKQLKTTSELAGEESASVSGQIAKIEALSKIVLDQTLSYQKRNTALTQLKEINKDYFGGLNLEKTKFNDLKDAIDRYTQSLIASAKTKGFEQEISRTSVELFKQEQLLNKLKIALEEVRREPIVIRGKEGLIDTSKVDAATSAYNAQNAVVSQLKKEQTILNLELQKSVSAENDLKIVVDARLEQLKKEEEAKKKKNKLDKEEIINNKQLIKDQYKLLEQKKDLVEFAVPQAQGSLGVQFDNFLRKLKEQAEIYKQLKQIEADRGKLTTGFINDFQNNIKNIQVPKIGDVIKKDLLDNYAEIQKATIDLGNKVKDTVENFIAAPLNYVFDTVLNQGKFSWKEFGKIVLQQLASIISKIVATTIAIAAADVITKGGYSATMKVLDKTQSIFGNTGGKISPSLAYTPRGLGGSANFGGITGGGMALSGSVVMVQRGSDLVGVLSRTNASINKVG